MKRKSKPFPLESEISSVHKKGIALSAENSKTAILDTLQVPENQNPDFLIVGIGASAGGLGAFEAFFSGIPDNIEPNMAFVIVQHLAPDHKSILSELIKKYTTMQVFEVSDGLKIRPKCTYIIPPNYDIRERMRLRKRRTRAAYA